MKVMVMDEARKRGNHLADLLAKSRHSVICCHGSNDFLKSLMENKIDKLLLDFTTWHNGRMIYSYFGINGRLDSIPIVFYNTPEDFPGIQGRPKHNNDKVVTRPATIDAIISSATAGN